MKNGEKNGEKMMEKKGWKIIPKWFKNKKKKH